MQNEDVKNKVSSTNTEKYGNKSFLHSQKYKDLSTLRHAKRVEKRYPTLLFKTIDWEESRVKCLKCNKNFKVSLRFLEGRNLVKHEPCIYCNPVGAVKTSHAQKEVYEFIKDNYSGEIKQNVRKVLHKRELDIYLPELKLAIEYNGVYWHNELALHSDYHLNKTKDCLDKGIKLVHIFEDDWGSKKEIIKSRLLSLIN